MARVKDRPMIVKHVSVLDFDSEERDYIRYTVRTEPDEVLPDILKIRRDLWEDMGRPAQVTIRVLPGNRVNDPIERIRD